MKQRLHILPLGRPKPLHHASLACWCHPLPKEHGEMAIHNAKDGREKWERQGIIDQDKPWCLVYEDVPDGDLRVPLFPQNAGDVARPAADRHSS